MRGWQKISIGLLVVGYAAAGVNHFLHPGFYTRIMPGFIPYHLEMVYLSGIVEMVLAILLVPGNTRRFAATMLVLMLTVFFIVHIDMLVKAYTVPQYPVPVRNAWIRFLLQPLLIGWAASARRLEGHML
jgi:uncharacterized membrane protein